MNPQLVEAHINLGNVYLGQKDYAQAQSEYQQALTMNPNNVLAHYNLGLVYTGLGNLDGAMNEYNAAIGVDSKY
ncbi:tetratricopeptide repeat protein, partial [Acinetobacter baumannii]